MKENIEERRYIIPNNYMGSGRLFGLIKRRNLIEAVVVFIAIYYVLQIIPFTTGMRTLVFLLTGLPLSIWFLKGMNDEAITMYVYAWFLYKKNRKNARLLLITKTERQEEHHIREFNLWRKRRETNEL